jgi:HEAT repeat protein
VSFAKSLVQAGDDAPRDEGEQQLLEALLSRVQPSVRQAVARAATAELDTDDPGRRERAFLVLWCLRDAGVEALREALGQPQRIEAAWALGRLRDSTAIPDLLDLLDGDEARARAAAARALGQIRDPRAVEGLLRASTDREFVVREASTEALDRLGVSAVVFAIAAFVQPLLPGTATGRVEQASFPLRSADHLRFLADRGTPESPAPDSP